ncbi:hypothetical protein [Thermoleptolyngbya sp.]
MHHKKRDRPDKLTAWQAIWAIAALSNQPLGRHELQDDTNI